MLCEHIGDIFGPCNLFQKKVFASDAILYPKISRSEVPYFSKASSAAHAHCGCGVSEKSQVLGEAKILGNGPQAHGDRGSFGDPSQFCLSTGEGHRALRRAPVSEQMPASHGSTPDVERRVERQPAKSVSTDVMMEWLEG